MNKGACLFTVAIILTLIMARLSIQDQKHLRVDLPEEAALISDDSTHATLMIAYKTKDVIHLGFKH